MCAFGEAIDEAIAPNIPWAGTRLEALFAVGQRRKILAEVTSHARFVNGFHHLHHPPRASRAVAWRLPRPALALTRGVPPIPVDIVALPAHRVHHALTAGNVIILGKQRAGAAFEVR